MNISSPKSFSPLYFKDGRFAVLFILFFNISIFSQHGGVTPNILKYGIGPRAFGLGKAYIALSDDITASFWNPAGLVQLYQKEITLNYELLFVDSSLFYLGYAHPIFKQGVITGNILALTTGTLLGTGEYEEDLGLFDTAEFMFIIAYGRRLETISPSSFLKHFNLGVALKMNIHKIQEYTRLSIAFDIGTIFIPPKIKYLKDFTFGFKIVNILPPTMKFEIEREWYPLQLVFGLSYRTLYDTLIINLDINQILFRGTTPEFHFGIEYFTLRFIRVRTGYCGRLSFGIGFEFDPIKVDYAFSYNFYIQGFTHQIGLTYKFGEIIP